jgi:hypothetical protein
LRATAVTGDEFSERLDPLGPNLKRFQLPFMSLTETQVAELVENYIRRPAELTEQTRSANVTKLVRFVRNGTKAINEIKTRQEVPYTEDKNSSLSRRQTAQCRQMHQWMTAVGTEIKDFELSRHELLLNYATFLLDYIRQDPTAVAAMTRLHKDWQTSCRENPDFQAWRSQHRSLHIKLHHIQIKSPPMPDRSACLCSALVSASSRLDPELLYTPPSTFDYQLEEYISNDPFLMAMLAPAAMIITDGTPSSLMPTIGELNKAILANLGITGGPPVTVMYIALVRILFGVSYTQNPSRLSGDIEANSNFMIACELFARQPVRQLDLGEAISRKYTPGLPIASLFNPKQFGLLRPMEWMTNPIDLLYCVNQILKDLARFFASDEGFLAFDDTIGLLLALLSISPPSNAIAIVSFLSRWECVPLSQNLLHAATMFGAAVEHILAFAKSAE